METVKAHGYFFFLLVVLWTSQSEGKNVINKSTSQIDKIRQNLLQLDIALEKELHNPKWTIMADNETYLHLIKAYKTFGNKIDKEFSNSSEEHLNSLSSIWIWAKTQEEIRGINGLYMIFRQMQWQIVDRNETINMKQLSNFAKTILSDPNGSIIRALERIADYIIHHRLFILVYQEASTQICNQQQSPQQLLYNLYSTIALAEIKGYTMIQFSYMLLRLYISGSNFNEEMKLLKQQYIERTYETLRAVKSAMAFAPRDLWRCDPEKHREEDTYTELKQLFQGYIVNEVDMNSLGTCRESCGYYGYTKVHSCYENQFCMQQRTCTGKLVNCKYIDSDMWICPSKKESSRRYEYIEYENGRVFGHKDVCKMEMPKVDSWWRWLFWHCSYCFCYCDDHNSSSDRYFNLRQVTADMENNKIVTGVKLVKVNQIIHIQIQEAVLLPRGGVNSTSIAWKPIEEYSIYDPDVRNGEDYHTIMWEQRGVDLDDLIPSEEHLLTGIRFRTIGSRLNLEIRVTAFNFTSGKLIPEKSFWMSNDNTDRSELKLTNPDIPTRSLLQHLPDSRTFEYLNFAPSDDVKDAAQSTVPFLDTQPIEAKPPVLMAGAGIFHKGRKGSGGFFALKLITYDFTPHLQTEIPDNPTPLETANEVKAV